MWCRANDNSACIRIPAPLVPGTECVLSGDGMGMGVCHHGNCVTYSEVASPIEGGWGEWGEWTNCSLPCGSGIQHSERFCDSPV